MNFYNRHNHYFEKQRKFTTLVKEIQYSLTSKEYKNQGYSLNKYVKMRWNISQAQAYRYLICAKVIDQLEEFQIQPCYERLCKSLYDTAKTPLQMKILWSTILQKTNNNPEYVNSTHISKIWKEICKNEKYANICFPNDLSTRMEKSLHDFKNEKKHKQINTKILAKKPEKKPITIQTFNTSSFPSPITPIITPVEPFNVSKPINNGQTLTPINTLSPISNFNSYSYDKPLINKPVNYNNSVNNFDTITVPSMKTIYYLPITNEKQQQNHYQYQNPQVMNYSQPNPIVINMNNY